MTFALRSILSKKASSVKTQKESVFQPEFRDDLKSWVETDRKTALRIFQLIESVMRDPFQGR
ncbi:type II toxin-antitoxin system YoeB family toxin [Desulfobacter vibrioformis]|uniref:type II toxin-antitoxin system YoeB family toxin n=1 Tax=Desulfobacter vibrioformis TaxID=34031 RepID=UPI0009FFE2C9|nr:type II toxin-antitoxin system YoeB family toxin [Desulfobacter vibrioformis]